MSLSDIAELGLEVFVFPIAATLWFNTKTLSGGWTAAAITYFWFLVRVGFNIRDPLQSFSLLSPDIETALLYYFGWFPLLIALGTFVGWLICLLMDMGEPIGLYKLFPSFRTHNLNNVVSTPCDPVDLVKLRDYFCACDKGIEAWCFTHIEPNYWHVLIGILLAIITLFLPHVLFWLLFDRNKWLAFVLAIVIAVLGYFAAWFYWSYWTDLRTWGPTEYNMATRLEAIRKDPYNSIYAEDPDITAFAPALYAETQARINKTVIVMALVHLFGFLLIGGLIVIPAAASLSIITIVGLIYLLAIAFIIALIAFIAFSRHAMQPMCPKYCPKTGVLLLANPKPLSTKKPITTFQARMKPRGNGLDVL